MRLLFAVLCILPNLAWTEGERTGDFDYYVAALSWSPNWCALEGEAKNSPQCDQDFGWVLHGLWPQYERGWPSYCPTVEANPTRKMTSDMADIMGTSGLAWHQWNKHGVCTGLSAPAYYDLSRRAYESINRPAVFRKLPRDVEIPASLIEEAFLKDNPRIHPDGFTVTCRAGMIQEVRVCLDKDLNPRRCGRDVIKDCTLKDAGFEAID
ncbi:MAG: ribonuclease T2 family protein [Planktomarina sp.]